MKHTYTHVTERRRRRRRRHISCTYIKYTFIYMRVLLSNTNVKYNSNTDEKKKGKKSQTHKLIGVFLFIEFLEFFNLEFFASFSDSPSPLAPPYYVYFLVLCIYLNQLVQTIIVRCFYWTPHRVFRFLKSVFDYFSLARTF